MIILREKNQIDANTFRNSYMALSKYLDTTQEHARGLALGEGVLARLEKYPTEIFIQSFFDSSFIIDDVRIYSKK